MYVEAYTAVSLQLAAIVAIVTTVAASLILQDTNNSLSILPQGSCPFKGK